MTLSGWARRLLLALLTTAAVLTGAVPAQAADGIEIDNVASQGDRVSVLVSVDRLPDGATPDLASVSAKFDGTRVEAAGKVLEAGEVERTTIITLDVSNSMRGTRFAAAKEAVAVFLEAAPSDLQVGLVAFAGDVVATTAPTTEHDLVTSTVEGLRLQPRTFVYDGVDQALNLAGDEGARSLLVLSDGADTGSRTTLDEIVTASRSSGVVVDVVSLDQSPRHAQALTELSTSSGGSVVAADPESLAGVFAARAEALSSQLLVTFDPPAGVEEGTLRVSVVADGTTYADSAFVSFGSEAGTPTTVGPSAPLVGTWALIAGAVALGLGLLGVLWVVLGSAQGPSFSEQRMSQYFGTAASVTHRSDDPNSSRLRDQAVSVAGKLVQGGIEKRIEQRLEGAGSRLSSAEWLLLHAGAAVGSAFVGMLVGGSLMMVVGLLLGAAVPWFYLGFRHSRRLSKFNAQLADTLDLMGGGLQAGLSLPQAVDTVIREGHEPMAGELRRALVEQRLGVDITEALDGIADRMDSEDFRWVVMAIRIQREVGGNLAEILRNVSETLREREYLRRQVKSLSAEGRLSGYILTALPVGIFIYMLLVNRDYVRPLYTTLIGFVMLAVAGILLGMGSWAMKKLATVEV